MIVESRLIFNQVTPKYLETTRADLTEISTLTTSFNGRIEQANKITLKDLFQSIPSVSIKTDNSEKRTEDPSQSDDAGKRLESTLRVSVKSAAALQAVIKTASDNDLMILPVGGASSALGQFIALSKAKQNGMKGVIAVHIDGQFPPEENLSKAIAEMTPEKMTERITEISKWVNLPTLQEGQELIPHPSIPMAIITSKNSEQAPLLYAASNIRVEAAQDFIDAILNHKDLSELLTNENQQKIQTAIFDHCKIKLQELNIYIQSEDHLEEEALEKAEKIIPYDIGLLSSFLNPEAKTEKQKKKLLTHSDRLKYWLTKLGLLSQQNYFSLRGKPTSKKEATLGGCLANGAQGSDRDEITIGLTEIQGYNAKGEPTTLQGDEAKKQAGKEGLTVVTAAVGIEISKLPPYRRGLFVKVKGKNHQERIKNMLSIQERLKSLSKTANPLSPNQNTQNSIITSIEPLSKSAVNISLKHQEKGSDDNLARQISTMINPVGEEEEEDTLGIFIAYNTKNNTNHDPEILQALGVSGESIQENSPISAFHDLEDPKELNYLDELRHGAPQATREEGKNLGFSTSSDMNIRVHTATGLNQVAEIYAKYIEQYTKEPYFHLSIYGHAHPGPHLDLNTDREEIQSIISAGGAIDLHIRVSVELSHPQARFIAPEKIRRLEKDRRDIMERAFLRLDGPNISILRPEKSLFTNKTYWEWLCLKKPEEAKAHLAELRKHGFNQKDIPILAGRLPKEIPGSFPRIPGGIPAVLSKTLIDSEADRENLDTYNAAIIEFCQLSHRSSETKRAIRDVCLSTHEKLDLTSEQYNFFIETPDEAAVILERNFGKNHSYTVKTVSGSNWEEIATKITDDPNTVYAVDLQNMDIPQGLSMMITPRAIIEKAYDQTLEGKALTVHRNLYTMYNNWPAETLETPYLPAILRLGLKADQGNLANLPLSDRSPIISANPGPVLIGEGDPQNIQQIATAFADPNIASDPERQKTITTKLKNHLGISQESSMAWYNSATACMQAFGEALQTAPGKIRAILTRNDAFSLRLEDVLTDSASRAKGQVTFAKKQTPWNTGENSCLGEVAKFYSEQIQAAQTLQETPIIFLTPHKTSTGVASDPKLIIAALQEQGFTINKDYFLICDITSSAGAIDYTDPATGNIPFSGGFFGVQKALSCPAGLGGAFMSPELKTALGITDEEPENSHTLAARIKACNEGKNANPQMLAVLDKALKLKNQSVSEIQAATKKKLDLVLGWLNTRPELQMEVSDGSDISPILLAISSDCLDMVVLKRLLNEVFGFHIGGGYGPFEAEAMRLYLPTVTEQQIKKLLAAIDYLIAESTELKEANQHIAKVPRNTVFAPYNPLQRITELSKNLQLEHILTDLPTISWIESLVMTYNANNPKQQIEINDEKPQYTSTPHKTMAKSVYTNPDNLAAIKALLEANIEVDNQTVTMLQAYSNFQTALQAVIAAAREKNPHQDTIESNLQTARQHLATIAQIMKTHIANQQDYIPPVAATAAPKAPYNLFAQAA